MYGAGQPKILEWKLLKDALTGIGLLKYYAGDFGDGQDFEPRICRHRRHARE